MADNNSLESSQQSSDNDVLSQGIKIMATIFYTAIVLSYFFISPENSKLIIYMLIILSLVLIALYVWLTRVDKSTSSNSQSPAPILEAKNVKAIEKKRRNEMNKEFNLEKKVNQLPKRDNAIPQTQKSKTIPFKPQNKSEKIKHNILFSKVYDMEENQFNPPPEKKIIHVLKPDPEPYHKPDPEPYHKPDPEPYHKPDPEPYRKRVVIQPIIQPKPEPHPPITKPTIKPIFVRNEKTNWIMMLKKFEDGWKVTNTAEERLKKKIDEYNSTFKPESKLNIDKYLKLNEEHMRPCSVAANTFTPTPDNLYSKASTIIQNLDNLKGNQDFYIISFRMIALQIIKNLDKPQVSKNVLFYNVCLIKLIDGSHPGFAEYIMFEITKAFPILIGKIYPVEATNQELGYMSNDTYETFDRRLSAHAKIFYLLSVLNIKKANLPISEDEELKKVDDKGIQLSKHLNDLLNKKMNDYGWVFWASLSSLIKENNINVCTAAVLLGALESIPYFDKKFHNNLKEIAKPIKDVILPKLKEAVTKFDKYQGADIKNKLMLLEKWEKVASGNFESFKTGLVEAEEKRKIEENKNYDD